MKENEGYKNAFKATALFGGVQVFSIIFGVIKSKLVALWLGTLGYGIIGLFTTATNLIGSIVNLGLQNSAVREIASAHGQNDKELLSKTVKAINRWVLVTGIIGALLTIIFSSLISRWLFDNNAYVVSIILLSSVVLLTGIWNQQQSILQGTRNLKLLVSAGVFGSLASFLCSVPIFYFFREDGIVWAIIMTVLASTVVNYLYARKVKFIKVQQSPKESFTLGLMAVKLGLAMSITGIVVNITEFILKSYITRQGGIEDVGLYGAGWAINAQYLGLVFAAMAKDYYPRLSQKSSDNKALKAMVNEQAEIALLILSPMIIVMVVFISVFVNLLYSKEFLAATDMIKWMLIGSLMQAGSWSLSFVFLAKRDIKTFLFNELGIKFITLPAYMLGYYLFGLVGLGYAFTFNYTAYFLWVAIVAQKKYSINYTKTFWKVFFSLVAAILVFPIGEVLWHAKYPTGVFLIVIISIYCLYELNKRIELKSFFKIKK
ncbi:MAG: Polysaccharide biosynthesis protein [uncultured bacterium]|nr:MAG: Polysaccharide biosynthesis protein [uncultured bacterium]